jgi:hypothetical protein
VIVVGNEGTMSSDEDWGRLCAACGSKSASQWGEPASFRGGEESVFDALQRLKQEARQLQVSFF